MVWAALELIMDLKLIRNNSIRLLGSLGVETLPTTLPLLETESRCRSADEIVSRLLAMHAVAAVAYGFNRAKANDWIVNEQVAQFLTSNEKLFLSNPDVSPNEFRLQIEGMWVLAWAIGTITQLDFEKECDRSFVTSLPNLKIAQNGKTLRENANLRPLAELVAACDLAYCLHWVIRDAALTNKHIPSKLKPYVVIERRRALEWLLSKEAWDEISLDT
jgi:hypothetical protein